MSAMEMEKLVLIRVRRDYSEEGFDAIVARLDLLHDFASRGELAAATDLPAPRVRGWLEEIIFVARETIREMDGDGRSSNR